MSDVLSDAIVGAGKAIEARIQDMIDTTVLKALEVQQAAFAEAAEAAVAKAGEGALVSLMDAIKDKWMVPTDEAPSRSDPAAADVPDTSELAHIPS